jgi:isochorismate synthase
MALSQVAREPGPLARWAEVAQAPSGRPAFSWAHPDGGLGLRAFGVAAQRSSLGELELDFAWPEGAPGPWLGALAFDGRLGPAWEGFAAQRWFLPELFSWSLGGRHFVATFGGGDRALDEARRRLDASGGPDAARAQPAGSPAARIVEDRGARARWEALVARALREIGSGALSKVVLARAIEVEAGSDLDPQAVASALQAAHPSCRTFVVRGSGAAFVGATPEVLCRLEGRALFTEAVAGSARPGEGAALLGRPKELREHRWVVEHLVQRLSSIATAVQQRPEPRVRELANVAHLVTPISAQLDAGRTAADVVAALHPTPAVAGVPTAAALRFLSSCEELDRGLYAGLVGWAGPDRAELAVALRSALLAGRRARLFVGAGIVEGSSPEAEWAETELKARALLDALGVRR